MLVAFRDVVRTGRRFAGDLIFFGVADEESGGIYGALPIVTNNWDAVKCDYVLTEYGGTPAQTGPAGQCILTAYRARVLKTDGSGYPGCFHT